MHNRDIYTEFEKIIREIFANKIPKKIAVAVSGGIDSMALLLLLKQSLNKEILSKKTKIFCINIDHNLRPNSKLDSRFVVNFCQEHSISCNVLKSYLTSPPENNIEQILREVRYHLLQKFCAENQIKHLFLAHHKQDLAENFLIRLFRGSGIDGLASIEKQSKKKDKILGDINIIRPLLEFNKEDLEQYLKANKTSWVEDESNEDEKYLRNKIRKFLKTLPDSKAISDRINLASQAILESRKIIEKQTKKKFPQIFKWHNLGYFLFDIKKFQLLPKAEATRYLSLSLMKISGNIYKPRLKKLEKIYQLILQNKLSKALSFYGCILEAKNQDKLNKEILIYREKSAIENFNLTPDLLEKLLFFKFRNKNLKICFDNRFKIKISGEIYDNLVENKAIITTLEPNQFNQLAKLDKQLQKIKNPIKKVFYTIPVLQKNGQIIAIPQINYFKYANSKQINIIHC